MITPLKHVFIIAALVVVGSYFGEHMNAWLSSAEQLTNSR